LTLGLFSLLFSWKVQFGHLTRHGMHPTALGRTYHHIALTTSATKDGWQLRPHHCNVSMPFKCQTHSVSIDKYSSFQRKQPVQRLRKPSRQHGRRTQDWCTASLDVCNPSFLVHPVICDICSVESMVSVQVIPAFWQHSTG
jgi:hypothetical protein